MIKSCLTWFFDVLVRCFVTQWAETKRNRQTRIIEACRTCPHLCAHPRMTAPPVSEQKDPMWSGPALYSAEADRRSKSVRRPV
jgi:hypothetical protein